MLKSLKIPKSLALFVLIGIFLILGSTYVMAESNTPETAIEITPGQQITTGINANGEVHWYKMTLDHTTSIMSDITNNSGTIYYEIYNEALNKISSNTVISASKLSFKVNPGYYYIKISQYSGINYSISSISVNVSLREQDSYENNDSAGQAYNLTFGQTLTDIGIEAENDVDWFVINADHNCSIVSQISNNSGRINYEIYDANFNKIYNNIVLIESNKFSYKVVPGVYYLKISNYMYINYASSDISLQVSLREQDSYENNDSAGQAYNLTLGQTVTGIGIEAENDGDWFILDVDQTSSIESQLCNNSGRINYEIYDIRLNRIYYNVLFAESKTFSYKVAPGIYYIKLSNSMYVNYAISNISMNVNLVEESPFQAPTPMQDIILGQQITTNIEHQGDYHWFKVETDHICSIVSEITNNSGYINYELYDSGYNKIYWYNNIGTTTKKLSVKVSPGEYYIKIVDAGYINYSISSIALKVSLREQDQLENNDFRWQATQVTLDQTYSGVGIEGYNDSDWFKVETDHICSIVSEITNNSGYINYELYDSGYNKIYWYNNIGTTTKKLSVKVSPGEYYIKIVDAGYINYSISSISLKVSLREQDQLENNDFRWQATLVTLGQTYSGIGIEAYNDSDWFKVETDHICSIVSEITNNSGYINYELYDSSYNKIYWYNNIGTTTKKLSVKVSPGSYFIRLANSDSVNYFLSNISFKTTLSKEYEFLISMGNPNWCGQVGEPVNIINGNYYSENKDLSIPTRSIPLEFIRYYNSRNIESGPLGIGWQHNYNSYLTVNADNSVSVMYGDGHSSLFTLSGGVYLRQAGCYETLVKNADGTYTLTFKDQLKYQYSTAGKLTAIQDKNNNITSLQYTNSLLTSVTEPAGRILQFVYDPNNRLTTITDPAGRSLVFTYDANGNMITAQDLNGGITTYTYEDYGLATALDPENHYIIKNTYDAYSKVIEQEDGKGQKSYFIYDPVLRKNIFKDARGNETTYFYDDKYRQTKILYPDNTSIQYTYDANYNKTGETDANGNTTTYTYDSMGNLLTKTDPAPLNYVTGYTYDSLNNPLTITNAASHVTTLTYDSYGNLLSTGKTVGGQTAVYSFTYTQFGQVETITNALGKTSQITYDTYGNQIQVVDANNNTTSYTYDNVSRKLTKTDPRTKTWTYTYDNAGNILTETDPLNFVTACTYDANNNLVTKTDPLNNTTAYTYDENERLVQIVAPLNNITTMEYDANGNKMRVTYANNNVTAYEYDARNRLISQTDGEDNTESYTLDGNGNILTKTDGNNHVTTYAYDEINRLKTVTEAMSGITQYEYDALGNKINETNPNNHTTIYTYNEDSKLLSVTDALTNTAAYTYDLAGNKLSMTDPRGKTWTYTYDNVNRLLTVVDTLNHTTSYSYDANGNQTSVTDANNHTVAKAYDDNNRLIAVTDAENKTESYTLDGNGNILTKTDRKNRVTTYQYDALNRVTQVTNPLNGVYQYGYDGMGNKTSETDPRYNTTTYTYDGNSRLLSSTNALNQTTDYTYDGAGNKLTVTNPQGKTWIYAYDDNNRLISVADPLNNTTLTGYDAAGNIISKTDPNNHTITYEYDTAERLSQVTDPLNNVTIYTRDEAGNLIEVTDARGKNRTYQYDELNRLIAETDALVNSWTREYDPVGNLISRTKPGNVTVIYDYDPNNRLTEVTYPDQTGVIYAYDDLGLRTLMTDQYGTTSYTYDNLDRLQTVTRDGQTITYNYDVAGNLTSITYPNGLMVTYTVNNINLPVSVTDSVNTMTIAYDNNGRRTEETLPNGVTVSYAYDDAGHPTLIQHNLGGTIIAKSGYTLDNSGNRLTMTDEAAQVTQYDYDYLSQLTQVTYPGSTSTQYAYDPANNRVTETDELSQQTQYAYNDANRLITINLPGGGQKTHTYDARGNLINVTSPSGTVIYQYDYEDRLIHIEDGTKSIEYTYDGDGNLISKSVTQGGTTDTYEYLYDYSAGLPRLLVEKKNSTLTNNYIYAGRLYSRQGPEGHIYYHQDGLGSTLAITDDTGQVLNRYTYDAFGEPTAVIETVENSILFTGEMYDQSGLFYLRARYYDPVVGRFITQDTLFGEMDNPLTQNLYVYCGNNPVNYTDPSGHMRCDQVDSLVYGMAQSVEESISGIVQSPLALWELIKGIKNGDISLESLLYTMGDSLVEPIRHLITNREVIWSKTVSDEQVYEYGRNLGFVLQEVAGTVAGGIGAAKTGIKAIDKLVDASKRARRIAEAEKLPPMNLQLFGKGAGKTGDDILSNASPGRVTKGKTTLYEKSGGFGQASKEFDSLNPSNVKEINTPNGTLKTGTLPDGRSITVRLWSTDGRPTLEIRNSNGRGVEIRYGE